MEGNDCLAGFSWSFSSPEVRRDSGGVIRPLKVLGGELRIFGSKAHSLLGVKDSVVSSGLNDAALFLVKLPVLAVRKDACLDVFLK